MHTGQVVVPLGVALAWATVDTWDKIVSTVPFGRPFGPNLSVYDQGKHE